VVNISNVENAKTLMWLARLVASIIMAAIFITFLVARMSDASAQVQCRPTNSVATSGWYIGDDPITADLLRQIDEERKENECILLSDALKDPPPVPRPNPDRVPHPRPRPDYPAVEPAGDKLKSPAKGPRYFGRTALASAG